ncbi:sensor histidine kinase [Algibacter lectus]|uniref:sensor histidine kinase n=1 Tax=Algibacter lectus TaxID=221126 RepID=UPI0034E3920C
MKRTRIKLLKNANSSAFFIQHLKYAIWFCSKKADETPDMILKLSNLLDYLLYQTDKPFVSLTEEIHHIEDYIALEKMRFNNTLNINFKTSTVSEALKIAPMLLLPFVENSFKHGVIKNGELSINIDLRCDENKIHLQIVNTASKAISSKSGIGLDNIKKRLDLLYLNQYELKIDQTDDLFTVNLNLNLN